MSSLLTSLVDATTCWRHRVFMEVLWRRRQTAERSSPCWRLWSLWNVSSPSGPTQVHSPHSLVCTCHLWTTNTHTHRVRADAVERSRWCPYVHVHWPRYSSRLIFPSPFLSMSSIVSYTQIVCTFLLANHVFDNRLHSQKVCLSYLHHHIPHVVVLLGVKEGSELLTSGDAVMVSVGVLEAAFVAFEHGLVHVLVFDVLEVCVWKITVTDRWDRGGGERGREGGREGEHLPR